ncbi:ROK family protein [Microbacterium oryzae]|uniref:ROK family protein n=1 Tax=Microbacterium oryzae TaxID=743009 RepID=UPI0025AF820B|nr:ROK family protein [Microbacterium oryzae]MDN3311409.1 ROK family protein [Microbacterium oryzae]
MVEGTANSAQMLRRMNSDAVVRFALRVAEFTAAEVMAETRLARATVLGVCDELVEVGWLEEIEDSRAAGLTSRGRPARRYRLRDAAGVVLGMDAGEHRLTAVVADLRGVVLAEESVDVRPEADGVERRAVAASLAGRVAAGAGVEPDDVLLAVVGIPAPVNTEGRSPRGRNDFWTRMNPGFSGIVPATVLVENDANLAAVAEQANGLGPGDVATVLSGERLGTGVILDGHLLRGALGGAGEMHFLEIVEGVGSAEGIGALARQWGRAELGEGGEQIDAESVFRAAASGDGTALDIIRRLGERVARVAVILSSLLGVEQVVVAGGIADAVEPVLIRAREALDAGFSEPVPRLVASALGGRVVVLGAVEFALGRVRAEPSAFSPRPART